MKNIKGWKISVLSSLQIEFWFSQLIRKDNTEGSFPMYSTVWNFFLMWNNAVWKLVWGKLKTSKLGKQSMYKAVPNNKTYVIPTITKIPNDEQHEHPIIENCEFPGYQ